MTKNKNRGKILNCIIIAISVRQEWRKIISHRFSTYYTKGSLGVRHGPWRITTLNGVIVLMANVKEQKLGKNVRMSFSKTKNTLELPNLVEIQTKSFKWFLEKGLTEVLHDVSPITDYSGNLSIEFLSFSLDSKPKSSVEECKERDANYAAPLKVNVRLTNKQTGEVKQTDIFMGELPIMTETGTFVINGAERVIVSQIVRSPGMYYSSEFDKSGKKT